VELSPKVSDCSQIAYCIFTCAKTGIFTISVFDSNLNQVFDQIFDEDLDQDF